MCSYDNALVSMHTHSKAVRTRVLLHCNDCTFAALSVLIISKQSDKRHVTMTNA